MKFLNYAYLVLFFSVNVYGMDQAGAPQPNVPSEIAMYGQFPTIKFEPSGNIPVAVSIDQHSLAAAGGLSLVVASSYLLMQGAQKASKVPRDECDLSIIAENKEGNELLKKGALGVLAGFLVIFHESIIQAICGEKK
jgi:hypothetical protein